MPVASKVHASLSVLMACAGIVAAGACSVQEFASGDALTKLVNACEGPEDCQSTDTNLGICSKGMCIATAGEVESAYLEVVPPAAAFYGAGYSFLVPLDSLEQGDWTRDLQLPSFAQIEGRITTNVDLLGDLPSEFCENAYDASSESLRVHAKLSRTDGLPSDDFAAIAELRPEGWTFFVNVPSGTYNVYATALSGCDADFPPIWLPGQTFGEGKVPYEVHVGSIATLFGIVTQPEAGAGSGSLAGWQVSLLEPDLGRLISTTGKLSDSKPTTNFEIRYLHKDGVSPLLQLTPPEDVAAPTIVWDLSVLDLDGDGRVQPDLSALDLSTVEVSARIIDSNIQPIADASVSVRSTRLTGASSGLSAHFESVVSSDDEGAIHLEILPGTYQLIVKPPDPTELAITESSWEIAPAPAKQAGRTVELAPMTLLEGAAVAPVTGQSFEGIQVSVMPSTFATAGFLERMFNPAEISPRLAFTVTDNFGQFAVPVDPGSVDLSARPDATSNFPWLVRARVDVPTQSLGPMPVSFPVPLAGTLRDPNGNTVQSARLRVFALLDSEDTRPARKTDPHSVIQIAEGRTDELGNFVLLLPSKLSGD